MSPTTSAAGRSWLARTVRGCGAPGFGFGRSTCGRWTARSNAPAANGELAEAIQAAEDALAVEPFRETTYQRLMRVHAGAGNRAEALRTYERCRSVLSEELGVPPSAETEAVYTAIVRA